QGNASTDVQVLPDGSGLTLTCDAQSHVCLFDHATGPSDSSPRSTQGSTGSASRTVKVNLISRDPIVDTGRTNDVLLLTARGLCCGVQATASKKRAAAAGVVGVYGISAIGELPEHPTFRVTRLERGARENFIRTSERLMTPQHANELADIVRSTMLRNMN